MILKEHNNFIRTSFLIHNSLRYIGIYIKNGKFDHFDDNDRGHYYGESFLRLKKFSTYITLDVYSGYVSGCFEKKVYYIILWDAE